MKIKLIILLLTIFSSSLNAENIDFKYLDGNIIIESSSNTSFSVPYTVHPNFKGDVIKSLIINKKIFNIGNCIIVNHTQDTHGEPHASPQGDATIYNLQGEIVETIKYPLIGQIIKPQSKEWGIIIFEFEGLLTNYIHIGESCKTTSIPFLINNKDVNLDLNGKNRITKNADEIIIHANRVSKYGIGLITIAMDGNNNIQIFPKFSQFIDAAKNANVSKLDNKLPASTLNQWIQELMDNSDKYKYKWVVAHCNHNDSNQVCVDLTVRHKDRKPNISLLSIQIYIIVGDFESGISKTPSILSIRARYVKNYHVLNEKVLRDLSDLVKFAKK